MIDLKEKICFACLRLKNIDEFHKHNSSCDGHRKRCIVCSRNNVKIDPEKIKHLKKMCTECKILFYINNDNFAYNKQAQDGYDGICKKCQNIKHAESVAKTIEKNFVELSDFESGVKICKECKKSFYANSKYFYKRPGKLSPNCVKCTKKLRLENKIKRQKLIEFKKISIERWDTDIDKLNIITKECNKCSRVLMTNYFNNDTKTNKPLNICKKCITEYKKEHYKENKDEISQWKKDWCGRNQDRLIEKKKNYYIENKEEMDFKSKQYYENNKDAIEEKSKIYREENKELILKNKAKYYKDNVDDISEKGKIKRKSLIKYNSVTFQKLMKYDECRQDPNNEKLGQVKCAYCNKWINPTYREVGARMSAINGTGKGEGRIYCNSNVSDCKDACGTYGKNLHPRGLKIDTSREAPPWLRIKCFERDEWECQRCGDTTNLRCHHIFGYTQHPQLGCDLDFLITYCQKCHNWVHHLDGCTYHDLQCKI